MLDEEPGDPTQPQSSQGRTWASHSQSRGGRWPPQVGLWPWIQATSKSNRIVCLVGQLFQSSGQDGLLLAWDPLAQNAEACAWDTEQKMEVPFATLSPFLGQSRQILPLGKRQAGKGPSRCVKRETLKGQCRGKPLEGEQSKTSRRRGTGLAWLLSHGPK